MVGTSEEVGRSGRTMGRVERVRRAGRSGVEP